MIKFRHSLRVSEAITIRINDVDHNQSWLWVRRLKNGLSVEQLIPDDELRAIKRYRKHRADGLPWFYIREQEREMTRRAVNYIVENASNRAGHDSINPDMLRYGCGFYVADQEYDLRLIKDYLGHRNQKIWCTSRALPIVVLSDCRRHHDGCESRLHRTNRISSEV